jgi:PAS domain S-box-containing protein
MHGLPLLTGCPPQPGRGNPAGIGLLIPKAASVVNQVGLRMLGRSETDLPGTPFVDVWPEASRSVVREALRTAGQGASVSVEATFTGPAGDSPIWELKLKPVGAVADQPTQIVASFSDVSGRKRVEEKLRIAQFTIECAADAVMLIDENGRVYECNPAACAPSATPRELWHVGLRFRPGVDAGRWKQVWEARGATGASASRRATVARTARPFPWRSPPPHSGRRPHLAVISARI